MRADSDSCYIDGQVGASPPIILTKWFRTSKRRKTLQMPPDVKINDDFKDRSEGHTGLCSSPPYKMHISPQHGGQTHTKSLGGFVLGRPTSSLYLRPNICARRRAPPLRNTLWYRSFRPATHHWEAFSGRASSLSE